VNTPLLDRINPIKPGGTHHRVACVAGLDEASEEDRRGSSNVHAEEIAAVTFGSRRAKRAFSSTNNALGKLLAPSA